MDTITVAEGYDIHELKVRAVFRGKVESHLRSSLG